MKLATSEDMKKIDDLAVKEHGLTIARLMESAGGAVVEAMEASFGNLSSKTVGVVCGKGHNGGDGFVTARLLKKKGASVVVVLGADPEDLQGETLQQYLQAKAAKIPVLPVLEKEGLKAARAALEECDLLVDALFGTGLSRPVEGLARDLIATVNSLHKSVTAVDLPSGLSADSGVPQGDAVKANLTVTFGLAKTGFYTSPAASFLGEWRTVNIGFPQALLDAAFLKHETTEEAAVQRILPKYDDHIHKGTRGRVLLVAGATGLTGAACLSALAAQRVGAGLVTVACPESLNPILEAKLTEPMTAPVPEVEGGFLSLRASGRILHLSANVNAVVVGPGIGRHRETGQLLRDLLTKLAVPLVVDADALNLLGGQLDIFKTLKVPVVLTPHPGEAAWLLKTTITDVEQNRLRVARQIAAAANAVVVLKGRHTLIANPQGDVRFNPTGNRALATAGTGDVLSGMIGGLLAQRLPAWDAAVAAVYLHGLAGEKACRRMGPDGVLAGDLLPLIPKVLRRVKEKKAESPIQAESKVSPRRRRGSREKG